MKNLFYGFLATILLGTFSYSQDLKNLNRDEDFISFVQNEFEFIKKANSEKLNTLRNVKLNEKNINEFYEVFGINDEEFVNFVNNQNLLLKNIGKSNNINFTPDITSSEAFIIEIGEVIEIIEDIPETMGDCERRYRNTLAINFSVAVGAHIACGAADLTVIGGIICHGAVALAQMAADDNAYLDYKDCMKKD